MLVCFLDELEREIDFSVVLLFIKNPRNVLYKFEHVSVRNKEKKVLNTLSLLGFSFHLICKFNHI